MTRKTEHGFSLVEILIVIAIIGVLSSVILGSLHDAKQSAQIAKAQSEIRQVRSAVGLLADDTNSWPNGCAVGAVVVGSNNEIELTNACSGITQSPPASGCTCSWSAEARGHWNGPYYNAPLDPWGHPYWYDSDYYPRKDCGNPSVGAIAAIVSVGPNGTGGPDTGNYDCDDIYLEMR